MANIFTRIAGTSEHSFRIGLGGFTLYTGTTDPNVTPPTPNSFGFGNGDMYTRTLSGSVSVYVYDGGLWNPVFGVGGVDSFNTRTGIVTSQLGDYDANIIAYDNTGSGMTATQVQAAIDELDFRLDSFGGPFLELAGGTMNASADITMNTGGQILATGALANPGYSFSSDDQSGLHSPAVGELELVTGSAPRLKVDSSGRITAETANYETLVDADDVIPNKLYVDTRPIPYDLALYVGGPMASVDDVVGGMIVTRAVRIPAGVSGSQAYALTAGHGSTAEYIIKVNGSEIGRVQFAAATNAGTFTGFATDTDLSAGERITVETPNPIVAGIEDVMITIVGCAATSNCTPP